MAHFTAPDPSSLERVAYLVGFPIAHSLSPLLHHTIYSSIGQQWGQVLYETRDLNAFLEQMRTDPKFLGSSVTMPYKVAIIPHLDELTPEGAAIGAINTLFVRDDESGRRRYCGTNTDCVGIREAFLQNVSDPSIYHGKPALVVGGGGTARAAVYALQNFLGCSPIYMVNRDASEVNAVMDECNARGFGQDIVHVSTIEQAEQVDAPCAVVSAVPDFSPVSEEEKIARQVLATLLRSAEKGALLEMCYHPSPKTEIAGLATNLGWQVIMGTEAMIGQGLEQARLWTGIEVQESLREAARAAVRNAISERHKL
jgi:quinate dehydrogenase